MHLLMCYHKELQLKLKNSLHVTKFLRDNPKSQGVLYGAGFKGNDVAQAEEYNRKYYATGVKFKNEIDFGLAYAKKRNWDLKIDVTASKKEIDLQSARIQEITDAYHREHDPSISRDNFIVLRLEDAGLTTPPPLGPASVPTEMHTAPSGCQLPDAQYRGQPWIPREKAE